MLISVRSWTLPTRKIGYHRAGEIISGFDAGYRREVSSALEAAAKNHASQHLNGPKRKIEVSEALSGQRKLYVLDAGTLTEVKR